MKKKNVLLKVIIILLIMIVSLISFFGIYKRNLNSWENILPNYNFSKELGESSVFGLRVDTSTKEVEDEEKKEETENSTTDNTTSDNTTANNTTVDNNTTDNNTTDNNATDNNTTENNTTDNNTTTNETTDNTTTNTTTPKKQVPVNDNSVLNKENYKKAKEIVEQRLKDFEMIDSTVSFNEKTGEITISVPRGEQADYVPQLVSMQGKVEIVDTETKELLIDGSMIKKATTYYVPMSEGQTYEIGIRLEFNQEGKKKLNEISKKYIETTDAEGKVSQKTITTRIDDEDRHITYFPENYSYTYLPVRLYSSISVKDGDMTEFNESYRQAFVCQVAINSGRIPVVYTVVPGTYFANTSGENYIKIISITIAVILAVTAIIMIIKFKKKGLMATIIEIGYVAIVLLLIRAAKVNLTLSGSAMILFMAMLNYLLLIMFMNRGKLNEFTRFALNLIPFIITILVFNFTTDINIESVGMVGVWGLITFAYTLVTSIILLDNENTKKNGVEKNEE